MAPTVEVLITGEESQRGKVVLDATVSGARRAGFSPVITNRFTGGSDWLTLFGAGAKDREHAWRAQRAAGRRCALWDLGYFGRGEKLRDLAQAHYRVSVSGLHPTHAQVEATTSDPSRWERFGIELREDHDPDGHIVVIGLGPKTRAMLRTYDWEERHLRLTQERFPNRKVLYRPKPRNAKDPLEVTWPHQDGTSPIEEVLRGASLVVCRHSNVALDAAIAGVPVECEDGIAHWLYHRGTTPTREQRLDLLRRAAWWQWRPADEMEAAWKFLKTVCA